MAGPHFRIRFWGVRGSMPTPGARYIRTGGNTSCVSVEADDELVILDAGSGLRELGLSFGERAYDASILLSHYHWDHLLGFTSFAPLFEERGSFRIYGEGKVEGDAEAALMRQFAAPHFPVPFEDIAAELKFQPVSPGDQFRIGALAITVGRLNHPNGAVGYRIERGGRVLVYACDHEHDDKESHEALICFAKDADVLIYDATFDEGNYKDHEGWGHSTWEEALRVGERANIKERIVITHHDPSRTDIIADAIEAKAKAINPRACVAREGMVIEL